MGIFNRFVVKNFTKERYMSLVRSHPRLTEERTQIYLILIMTFLSLSFLGLFAISPTLTTIVELNRKLADSEFVNTNLKTKLSNLSSLNTQYEALANTWPVVDNAVSDNPKNVQVVGQFQTIAKESQVTITDIETFTVELSKNIEKKPIIPKAAYYVFTITAIGEKNNLLPFVKSVINFDRVVQIESISYANEETQSVTIRGRLFFTL